MNVALETGVATVKVVGAQTPFFACKHHSSVYPLELEVAEILTAELLSTSKVVATPETEVKDTLPPARYDTVKWLPVEIGIELNASMFVWLSGFRVKVSLIKVTVVANEGVSGLMVKTTLTVSNNIITDARKWV